MAIDNYRWTNNLDFYGTVSHITFLLTLVSFTLDMSNNKLSNSDKDIHSYTKLKDIICDSIYSQLSNYM